MRNESGLDFNPALRPQDKLDLFEFLPVRKSGWKSLAVHGGIQGPIRRECRAPGRWVKEELAQLATCLLWGM